MDEDKAFELQQLKEHAIEYGKAKDAGFEGGYVDYIEERSKK